MFKCSPIVAALLVPILAVSIATAAPKKKKKKKATPPATTQVAPAATPPTPPILDTAPKSSALTRVEENINNYSPKEAPPPTITKGGKDATPAAGSATPTSTTAAATPVSTTSLTSAEVPGAASDAPPVGASTNADVGTARPTRGEPLGEGFTLAPVADFGTSKVYGFGVGGRAAYTLSSRIYLGGTFMYHFGQSNGPLSYGLYYFGPEVGYSAPVGPIVVRPYVGGGYGSLQTTYRGTAMIPGGGGAGTDGNFTGRSASAFVWPGVTIFVPIGSAFALGADARVLFAPGQDSGLGTLANNGTLRFVDQSVSKPSSTALAAGLTASYRF